MSYRAQDFSHQASAYDRPNMAWRCGGADAGRACRAGPSSGGACGANTQCMPVMSGGRWLCKRAAAAGGACEYGPRPDGQCACSVPRCMPVRSVESSRRRTVRWLLAATVAALAVSLLGFNRHALISPGPLSVAHSEVQGCASCHGAADRSLAEWPRAALMRLVGNDKASQSSHPDSARCDSCHGLGDNALDAHNQSPAALAALSRDAQPGGSLRLKAIPVAIQKSLWPVYNPASEQVACATCHREHGGRSRNIASLDPARCQACHSSTFASFSKGHPAFADYPYAGRTRIVYSHASHRQEHFASSIRLGLDAPQGCGDCHRPDQTGKLMDVRGFETMCASCHMGEIDGSALAGPKAIRFLAAPELDQGALEECGIEIGSWPEYADGELGAFMRIILGADAGIRADLDTVAQLDLGDLSDAGVGGRAAAGRVAWAIKTLYLDLSSHGSPAIAGKLRGGIDAGISDEMVARLGATIPRDVIDAAVAASFPRLAQEVKRYREAGEIASQCRLEARSDEAEVEASQPLALTGSEEDILADSDDILADSDDILADGDDILADGDDILADGDDILADESEPNDAGDAPGESVRVPPISAEDWASYGGWYREDSTVFYRPVEHADQFLKAWLDVVLVANHPRNDAFGTGFLAFMSDKGTPGSCLECHSVERQPDGGLRVNWLPRRQAPNVKPFTKFVHQSHFSLLDERGCATCHQIDPDSHDGFIAAYEQPDSKTFVPSFKSLDIATCAGCHRKQSAGENCLLCHNYHVGEFKAVPPQAPFAAARPPIRP